MIGLEQVYIHLPSDMACFLSLFGGKKDAPFWVWVSFFVPETLRITLWFCWGIESKPIVWTEKKSLAKTQSNKTHPAAKKLGVDEFMLFSWRGVGIGVFPLKLILKRSLSEWFRCQASLLAAAHIKRRVPGRKARDLCASLAESGTWQGVASEQQPAHHALETNTYQVIPLFGGHQQPLKGSLNHPKKLC